jgi:DeoR family transcriptional regulator, glycerol-3-phosphate regulon repressor
MMPAETRQDRILDVLRRRGYAGIDELVSRFDVTPQTIRRDLQELSARGLLQRHHGGASIPSSTVNIDYAQRHVEQAAEKERIAAAAASLVTAGSSIFMTPGTTVEAVAAALCRSELTNLRVVTNSTVAAEILGRNRNITVCVTGGHWQASNHALAGPAAVEMVERYRCDFMLTSIGAVESDGWLLEFRDEEAAVAKAMMANARQRILVADHSKFSRVATCKVARVCEMTTFVTDRPPPGPFRRVLKNGPCQLVVAPGAPERQMAKE